MGVGAAMPIGAALGRKRRSDRLNSCAEMLKHMTDDWIRLDEKKLIGDLTGRVAVAHVPRQPHKAIP